jgi:hypothetical protein
MRNKLLIIIGTFIVGLAIVFGIRTISRHNSQPAMAEQEATCD